jgi:TetR/AcrR family transcriptional regulator, mexJK operon transcriptional repressor
MSKPAAVRRKAAAPSKPAKRTAGRVMNQAGRPTATELARRKALVMEIATDLFIEHGFAATSLVDIAKGAGVATRTLYQHFGDKEAIFREVIFARDAGEAVERPAAQPGDSLFDALMRGAHYAYAVTYREESIGLMRLMIAESTRFPEFMRGVANTIFARFRGTFESLLQSCETAGLVPPGNHARSAELFADMVLGTHPLMTYTNWDASPPAEADIEERVALFIRGRFPGLS